MKPINLYQLKDIIPLTDLVGGDIGPFFDLEEDLTNPCPWASGNIEDNINATLCKIIEHEYTILDFDFLALRLNKILSPIFRLMIDEIGIDNDPWTTIRQYLIDIILSKYLLKWTKLADGLFANYNPIENYSMTEHETTNRDIATNSKVEGSSTNTAEHNYKGFNSDDYSGVSKDNGTSSSSTEGLKADNTQEDDTIKDLTRSGNIGVTTSQQMIESEIELRKHNLIDIIYKDIDSILFLDYYL